ncbi:MAG TPA: MATE family efflux transporter, partial [Acetobacteraceae bacterium]|nr:MATE family efflux transporter [Acetobacteraceae bacterium]
MEIGRPASWGEHLRATVVLALPLVGLQLAQMTMGVTDTVMLGWVGPRELAGGMLGTQAIFLPYIFGVGFSQAALPLAAAAQGAGDETGVRRAVRMGLWVLAIYSALVQLPLWHVERLLLAAGQEPEVAALAESYVRIAMWSMLPALVVTGIRAFLTVVGHAYLLLAVIVAGALVNAAL